MKLMSFVNILRVLDRGDFDIRNLCRNPTLKVSDPAINNYMKRTLFMSCLFKLIAFVKLKKRERTPRLEPTQGSRLTVVIKTYLRLRDDVPILRFRHLAQWKKGMSREGCDICPDRVLDNSQMKQLVSIIRVCVVRLSGRMK